MSELARLYRLAVTRSPPFLTGLAPGLCLGSTLIRKHAYIPAVKVFAVGFGFGLEPGPVRDSLMNCVQVFLLGQAGRSSVIDPAVRA